ncbi:hypothetical protein F2Q70_00002969 [Brassica cretica]|uniref:Uncharacterized protein n=1 Tax=Brassica cretica TaxID=69181 RepID=A0A8S9IP11_BRACR|nr:hypothetical protein F2Q70_00002969 [Brassica cretica]
MSLQRTLRQNLVRTKYRLSQGNRHVSKSATDKLEYGKRTTDKPSSVATQRPSTHTARLLRSDRARTRLGRYVVTELDTNPCILVYSLMLSPENHG